MPKEETGYRLNPSEPPNPTVHLQVKEGGTAYYRDHAYGDRATLQVHEDDVDSVKGPVEAVDPAELLDVGERPNRPGDGSRVV